MSVITRRPPSVNWIPSKRYSIHVWSGFHSIGRWRLQPVRLSRWVKRAALLVCLSTKFATLRSPAPRVSEFIITIMEKMAASYSLTLVFSRFSRDSAQDRCWKVARLTVKLFLEHPQCLRLKGVGSRRGADA